MKPEVCPQCGAEVPPDARVCPQCGSDEETGWSEDARSDSLDLPKEDFDYEEFVEREFGEEKKSPVPQGLHWFWWLVAIGILGLFLAMFLKQ